ncbi:DUF262 domain-containing protein [Vibrio parahaemolyticus]|uniref:DUF262 domain-containing protein n=1 Tax=Vibrio parahaemolyticus TaxID=670 RepID=UPI000D52F89D|nr:DUF262 domain-containing protein [Vibrio parahaemolyticus]AWG77568.1 hypothetical protein C9I78_01375 [Vibrio parahaemolyticus]AWJ77197.1 hypothetical protein C7Y67_01495 [Vibrio parahaemolyticus]
MSKIEGHKININTLFSSEYFFRIPEYQRPYSWSRENCEQLFDDIFESDRDNEYFLGTVIAQEVSKSGNATNYDVIDGQQRMTTLQILMACLRDIIEDNEYKDPLKKYIYQPKNPVSGIEERDRLEVKERTFFKAHVQTNGSTLNSPSLDNLTDQQINIVKAVDIFNEKIAILKQSEIESLVSHISQRCIVIFVSTEKFDDAFRMFSIINDRGIDLRRIDILKAKNLGNQVMPDVNLRKEYSKKWEQMEDDLGGDEFERLINIIKLIEIKQKSNSELVKVFEDIFKKGKIKPGEEFIDYIADYKNIYTDLVLNKSLLDSYEDKSKFNSLINIMNSYLRGSDWLAPLLAYYKKFKTENIFQFLTKLERSYSFSWFIGETKDKRIIKMCSILKDIDKYASSSDVLSSNNFHVDVDKYSEILRSNDFAKRNFVKYALVKLEYLMSDITAERKFGAVSIEHILPVNPKDDSDWKKNFSDDERTRWTHSIANLVLLSKKKNSSASNFDFEVKKSKYLKGKISDLPRSLALLNETEWTPTVLETKLTEIVDLMTA